MCDLILSVPDHCLSFYIFLILFNCISFFIAVFPPQLPCAPRPIQKSKRLIHTSLSHTHTEPDKNDVSISTDQFASTSNVT